MAAAGVRRDGPQLADAAETIRRWCGYVLARQFNDPDGWELQNMLTVASLMIEAALAREESRGVHCGPISPRPTTRIGGGTSGVRATADTAAFLRGKSGAVRRTGRRRLA